MIPNCRNCSFCEETSRTAVPFAADRMVAADNASESFFSNRQGNQLRVSCMSSIHVLQAPVKPCSQLEARGSPIQEYSCM